MAWNADSSIAPRAQRAVAQLEQVGISPPPAVAEALDGLTALLARQPQQPDRSPLVDAVLADNAKKVAELAATEAAFPFIREAHGAAVAISAQRVLDVLRQHAPAIRADLEQLAQGHSDAITKAALIGRSTEQLVQAGRIADAQIVAARGAREQALNALHSYATRWLGGPLDAAPDLPADDAEAAG